MDTTVAAAVAAAHQRERGFVLAAARITRDRLHDLDRLEETPGDR